MKIFLTQKWNTYAIYYFNPLFRVCRICHFDLLSLYIMIIEVWSGLEAFWKEWEGIVIMKSLWFLILSFYQLNGTLIPFSSGIFSPTNKIILKDVAVTKSNILKHWRRYLNYCLLSAFLLSCYLIYLCYSLWHRESTLSALLIIHIYSSQNLVVILYLFLNLSYSDLMPVKSPIVSLGNYQSLFCSDCVKHWLSSVKVNS